MVTTEIDATGAKQLALTEKDANGTGHEVSPMVRLALEKDVDVEVLERIVALQERVTERDARLALARALAAFQSECPPIPRTREAKVYKDGVFKYAYKFAPLEKIAEVIGPYLTEHGLSYSHDGALTESGVEITCTLHHIDGASRTATFRGPIDASGGKNPIQQVSSARSYGRRYTLIDVLGLMTEEDDDGAAAGGSDSPTDRISDSQAADLLAVMDEVKADKPKFLKWLGVERVEDIPVSRYAPAVQALRNKEKKGGSK